MMSRVCRLARELGLETTKNRVERDREREGEIEIRFFNYPCQLFDRC